MLTRRRFLQGVALSAGAAYAAGPAKRVIVAGAGLAGLSAAYELEQAGHQVTILEAQTRAGGRVQTLREPFSDGLYGECRAVRISDQHGFTHHYVRQFGLALEPFLNPQLAPIFFAGGKRLDLRPLGELAGRYLLPLTAKAGDASRDDWTPAGLLEYDRTTLPALLRERGASAAEVSLLTLGFDFEKPSAAHLLAEIAIDSSAREWNRIRGGNDLLPKAFATRLAGRIHYGSPVVRIAQSASGVQVTVEQAGRRHTLDGDYLVCALPCTVLRQAEITPALPAAKQSAIQNAHYAAISRVYLQSRKRFWVSQGLSGFVTSDLPFDRLWPGAGFDPDARGLLHTYTWGRNAQRMMAQSPAERIRATVAEVAKVFPEMPDHFEGGTSKCWEENPWERGALIEFWPGEMATWPAILKRPEGRLHFAPEHTSSWPVWMQGALESGNRVAREIDQEPAPK